MTRIELPEAMAALRPKLGSYVETIERSAPYGAALLSSTSALQIRIDNREELVSQPLPTAGTVLTSFDGNTLRERALNGFDAHSAEHGLTDLLAGASFAGRQSVDPGPQRQGDFETPMAVPPASLSTAEKLERCREIHRRLKDRDPRIVNARVSYTEAAEHKVFRNRAADLAQHLQRVRLFVFVMVSGGDGVHYNWEQKSGSGGWERLAFSDEELQRAVDNALALLTAERIEPGEYTVVASPGVAGTICHESFGHGVETDMFLKGRAKAAGFVGRRVGSDLVHIWDDPAQPGALGGYFFDDEGMLAAPTHIVEAGIFRQGITDLYSASALHLRRTPNGRRQDYSRKAYARMTATFFGNGATSFGDMVAGVDHGVYLQKWDSGMEDPQGWGIQVTCHYGREIRGGRVTDRVFSPIAMTGYVPEVLQSIRAVGDDLHLDAGVCGKGHKEYVSNSAGGPHLLLKARLG